jgi:nitrate/nitrite transporter NarK
MIGSIGMLGSFIGPWAFGVARDHTGGYRVGVVSLSLPFLAAAVLVLASRRGASAPKAREPAPETAPL